MTGNVGHLQRYPSSLQNFNDSGYSTGSYAAYDISPASALFPGMNTGPVLTGSCENPYGDSQFLQNHQFSDNTSVIPAPALRPHSTLSVVEPPTMSRGKPGKRARSPASEQSPEPRGGKQRRMTASEFIDVTADQEEQLNLCLRQWERRDRLPTDRELKDLAKLAKLPPTKVAMWYGDKMRLMQGPDKATADPHDVVANSQLGSEVYQAVERYIKDAKDKDCAPTHTTHAAGGRFFCTSGCGYSTERRDDWVRHEEKKQPQLFWRCVACTTQRGSDGKAQPYITHRIDKFKPHVEHCHPNEIAEDLRKRSHVKYAAPFIRVCTFRYRSTDRPCRHRFSSWEERLRHYTKHFNDSYIGGPRHLPAASGPDPKDGNGGGANDSSAGGQWEASGTSTAHHSSSSTQTHAKQQGASGSGQLGTYTRQAAVQDHECDTHTTRDGEKPANAIGPGQPLATGNGEVTESFAAQKACARKSYAADEIDGECAYVPSTAETPPQPYNLIDVENNCLVSRASRVRFLALRHFCSVGEPDRVDSEAFGLHDAPLPLSSEMREPYRKAVELTKDMGFKYLWVDALCCQYQSSNETKTFAYEIARLIIVIGQSDGPYGSFWHFACDYSHLEVVESWARHKVSFESIQTLQQLGHGAYGVVDKVELRPTLETYARKIIYRTDMRPWHLREIEIMQKFRHPNIAEFVAAYYDHIAFNILMSPVADCNLRQFLLSPDRHSDIFGSLPQWYLSLARALSYIHSRSCRHKDIKPANILISGTKVLLTDFGASRDFSTSVSTSTGPALTTLKYCAPEVAAGNDRGRSADVFSLGCVFAEMITVELGKTLGDLHCALKIYTGSDDRSAMYHTQTDLLRAWLQTLSPRCRNESQRAVLRISDQMLKAEQNERPTAAEVVEMLCYSPYHLVSKTRAASLYSPRVGFAVPSNGTSRARFWAHLRSGTQSRPVSCAYTVTQTTEMRRLILSFQGSVKGQRTMGQCVIGYSRHATLPDRGDGYSSITSARQDYSEVEPEDDQDSGTSEASEDTCLCSADSSPPESSITTPASSVCSDTGPYETRRGYVPGPNATRKITPTQSLAIRFRGADIARKAMYEAGCNAAETGAVEPETLLAYNTLTTAHMFLVLARVTSEKAV